MESKMSRRNFLSTAAVGVTAAATALSAKSYAKVKGAKLLMKYCQWGHVVHLQMTIL